MGAGGIVTVCLGPEVPVAAHDGDDGIGQPGKITRHVAHIGPATVFVTGELAHMVDSVLDAPVVARKGQQLLGSVATCAERSEAPGHRPTGDHITTQAVWTKNESYQSRQLRCALGAL